MDKTTKWVIGIVALLVIILIVVMMSNGGNEAQNAGQGTAATGISDILAQTGEQLIDNSFVDGSNAVDLGDVI